MRRKRTSILVWALVVIAAGCIDSYLPHFINSNLDNLVVEGFINSGGGATTIKLTHIIKSGEGSAKTELKAVVSVEGENTGNDLLTEKGNGLYSSQLSVSNTQRYRIRIKTIAGKEYLSDFVASKSTPAIDDVTWQLDRPANGLQIYVTTHDPLREANYYQWEYDETWEYHADCMDPIDKTPKYTCWRTAPSISILVFTSSRLKEDIVPPFPLTFLKANSEQLAITYSILVKQYAISKEKFEYLQQLKKTGEGLGSLFDPQPTQLPGNIHCITDPSENVLGYMGVHDVKEKRIFIPATKLPAWFYKIPYWYNCAPTDGGCSPPLTNCVDCRLRGGTNIKPAFWIQ